mmetsp:Transcript_29980/g.68083  ORF Transcript_29980/g.68083 Transcript_29980/m.68083 type:complete len:212 (-) Transcript_29980:125-760(-)
MGSLLRLLRALALPPFPTCLLCLLALGLQSLNSGLLLLDAVLHAPIQTSCFLTHHQARKGRVLLRLRYGLDLRRMYDPLRSPPARSTRLLIHLLLLCLLLLGLRLGLLLLLARLRGLLGLALVRPRGPRSLRRLLVLLLFLGVVVVVLVELVVVLVVAALLRHRLRGLEIQRHAGRRRARRSCHFPLNHLHICARNGRRALWLSLHLARWE